MQRIVALLIACFAILGGAAKTSEAQQVSIDTVDPWVKIEGTASGQRTPFVVVYVHAPRFHWYMHPYAPGQGDHRSFAKVEPNGKWWVHMVDHGHVVDCVAALLVENPDKYRLEIVRLESISPRPSARDRKGLTEDGHVILNDNCSRVVESRF
jgi:hypothetical protein